MNNRNFQSVTNPLYDNKNRKVSKHMSLTDALTSNPKFSSLKQSQSPNHKKTNREVNYKTRPVSNFKKNSALSEMLVKKNMKGLSGVPTKKISIKELTNRKKSNILTKQKANVQNKHGLQNMLANKMKYGEHGYEKTMQNKRNVPSNFQNKPENKPENKRNETKVPEQTYNHPSKKDETRINQSTINQSTINIPSKLKYILSFCMCVIIVMFILIIIFMILYFTTFSQNNSDSSNIPENNLQQFSNKNLTNTFNIPPTTPFPTTPSPTTPFPTTPFPTTPFPTTPFSTTPFPTTPSPIILDTIDYNQDLKNYVQNITLHLLTVKEIVKVVLNTTKNVFLNLEQKYINQIENTINHKYNGMLSMFNQTFSNINRDMSNKINKSDEIVKKEILKVRDVQHNTERHTREIINSNIRKSNQNITKKINYHFQNMLSFINKTVSRQKFIQYNLTNNRRYVQNYAQNYVHKLEIPMKYILPFYVPFVLYFMYFCCKKYISKRQKKSILPLHIETLKKEQTRIPSPRIPSPRIPSSKIKSSTNKWKAKITELESKMKVLMELNKNEKINKNP